MATPETATQRERRLIVRAGVFVGLALVLFRFVVLLIGEEVRAFLDARKGEMRVD